MSDPDVFGERSPARPKRPQQGHDPGLDNLTSGEVIYESTAKGEHRVRYRTIAGVKRHTFVGSPPEAWIVYLESVNDLQATAKALYDQAKSW